jgi:hypothetical protein
MKTFAAKVPCRKLLMKGRLIRKVNFTSEQLFFPSDKMKTVFIRHFSSVALSRKDW